MKVREINSFKPKAKAYKKYDSGGLFLQVNPSGSRYWRMKYKFDGYESCYSIGQFPNISLNDARLIRDQQRILISQGVDPNAEKREKRENVKRRKTFEDIAREWHSKQVDTWSVKHGIEVLHSLERDIFPFIGKKHSHKIDAPTLLKVLRKIEDRGALDIVTKVRQRCGKIFNYAIATGHCKDNPANYLMGVFKSVKKRHHHYLKKADLPEYFKKLDAYKGDRTTVLGLKFTLLTLARTKETREATWEEIDFNNKQWTIPATRMKNGFEHIVPLSKQAIEILNQLKEKHSDYEFVFASFHKPQKQPMSENAMLSALYNMGYRGKATAHGFRATASTILNELNFSSDWVEKQLSHVSNNNVRRAYNHAMYIPQRTKMMQYWADFLDKLERREDVNCNN